MDFSGSCSFGQIQNVIEFANSLKKEDMWAVLEVLTLLGITLLVFAYNFFVWRKTFIILENQTLVIQRLTWNRKREYIWNQKYLKHQPRTELIRDDHGNV